MHNDNYDEDLNDDSGRAEADENVGSSRGDETRERTRRAYRESQEGARQVEGREKSVPIGDGDKVRVLLKAVNDVLNQYFPLKTLISAVEFEVFRDYIFQRVPEFAEDPVAFLPESESQLDLSTVEGVDKAIDHYLRDLFFHAGGTLIGELEPRKTRLEKRVAYFSSPEHFDALCFRMGRRKIRDDLDLVNQFEELLHNGSVVDRRRLSEARVSKGSEESARGKGLDSNDGTQAVDQGKKDCVWLSTYRAATEVLERYFDGTSLDVYDFETFRRLFFLRSRSIASFKDSPVFDEDEYRSVENALGAVFLTFDEFDATRLEELFIKLDDLRLFANKTPAAIDEVLVLALEIFRKHMNKDGVVEFLNHDSDFSSEYLAIAKYVVQKRFPNRRFERDYSDFGDFYHEFLRVAGPKAKATEDEVRSYFVSAGGVFRVEPTVETEDQGPASRSEAVKKVLIEYYPDGIDLFDHSSLMDFCKECAELGFVLEPSDSKVRAAICRSAVLCDLRAWAFSEELKKKLKDTVESLVRNNTQLIYYEPFFDKNEDWLSPEGVSNWRVLRSLIASCLPKYMFYDQYFESAPSNRGEGVKILDEVTRLWGAFSARRTVDELAERSYIPRELIRQLLENTPSFFSPVEDGFILTEHFKPLLNRRPAYEFKLDGFDKKIAKTRSSDFSGDGKAFLKRMLDEVKDRELDVSKSSDLESKDGSSAVSEQTKSEKIIAEESKSNVRYVSTADEVSTSDGDWRKRANLVARILSQSFKDGLLLSDVKEMERFRKTAEEKNLELSQSDDELLKQLKRVGFVCDGRLYVVSKRAKEIVIDLVDSWFSQDGSVVYYESFFERWQDVLDGAGVVSVDVLKNRLQKYLPNYVFSDDEYFTSSDDGRTLFEMVRDDLLLVWDGVSAKRVTELEKMIYVPRRVLEKVLRGDHDHFEVLLNGFWKRIDVDKKQSASKKKDSKK